VIEMEENGKIEADERKWALYEQSREVGKW